jgi:hypothetical protein
MALRTVQVFHMIIREVEERDISALSEVARKTYAETFGDGLTPEQLFSILESTRSEKYFKLHCGLLGKTYRSNRAYF